ncbi:hypothetical protein Q7C36_013925 [Tachysurus vachellii]|uniref:Uncharacterized protein n=1 Tax=Tachysurus vachellii TaxID=175792 RepID=A0AA88MM71_TACVA|nr:hypothetical protein Q7C36_013925 [Tachysurus vachellii]
MGSPAKSANMSTILARTLVLLPQSQNGRRSVPQVCLSASGSDPQSSDPGIQDKKDYIWRGDPERVMFWSECRSSPSRNESSDVFGNYAGLEMHCIVKRHEVG